MQLSPSLNTIDSPVATEVILLSLVDGTITGTNFRTFAWIVYPGATGYTFQLSATPCLATSPGFPWQPTLSARSSGRMVSHCGPIAEMKGTQTYPKQGEIAGIGWILAFCLALPPQS